jgi:hypothetical protein
VFSIMRQHIDKDKVGIEDETSKVYSVIFQSFLPGSIYVEAPSAKHVMLACNHFHGVTRREPELVSVIDAAAVLRCGMSQPSLKANSWVRIRRGIYSGDLAFVRQIIEVPGQNDDNFLTSSTIVTVNLLPRISLEPLTKQSKRKRTAHTINLQPINLRPEAEFFDGYATSRLPVTDCKRVTRDQDGKKQEDMWRFKKNTFRNGLLEKPVIMTSLNFEQVSPTREELGKWLESRDEDVVRTAKETIGKLRSDLRPGDRVKVTQGWAQGRRGEVQSIEGEEVTVTDDGFAPLATLPIKALQKYFVVGDIVSVVSGSEVGVSGWCIEAKEGAVLVSEHGTQREVGVHTCPDKSHSKISQFQQVWTLPEQLQRQLATFSFTRQPSVPGWEPPTRASLFAPKVRPADPHLPARLDLWKGMPVSIVDLLGMIRQDGIKITNPWKGYEGYIKSVNEHSEVDLELDSNQQSFRPKPGYAPVTHQTGRYCTSGCPVCLPQTISVVVVLSAQVGGKSEQTIDIAFIRPSK